MRLFFNPTTRSDNIAPIKPVNPVVPKIDNVLPPAAAIQIVAVALTGSGVSEVVLPTATISIDAVGAPTVPYFPSVR